MDDGLKQRLIGAFVLFALAVIFVPVFFDRERIEPLNKKTQIPSPPQIETVEIAPLVPELDMSSGPAPEEMYVPDERSPVSPSAATTGFDGQGTPQAWVLQIASFRFEKHATEYRDKLIKDGFSAYVRTAKTAKGDMTRVFVGPKLDREVLLQQKELLQKKYKVNPILLKFEP